MTTRADELAHRLQQVRARIAQACEAADRTPDSVRLLVVTKTYPADDLRTLADLGVTDVGESRHPEAAEKYDEMGDVARRLTWHFVGALQTNKASAVARYADWVHSVDRSRLVRALSSAAHRHGRVLNALVQVSLDPPETADRSGVRPEQLLELADEIARADGLELRGVMAIAPPDDDPDRAFARLSEVAGEMRSRHPDATVVSAGMSGDLEAAIRHGATHVRIGRAVLGERPPLG